MSNHSITDAVAIQERYRPECDPDGCQGCPDCPQIPFSEIFMQNGGWEIDDAENAVAEIERIIAGHLPPLPIVTDVDADWVANQEAAARAAFEGSELEPEEPEPPETLATFRQEVTLADQPIPPAALERNDGATLLYEGRLNTVYGETSMGKTWVAVMAAIAQLRRGGKVLWMDNEDRPRTLAERLAALRATDLIGVDELAFVGGDLVSSETATGDALIWLSDSPLPALIVLDSAVSLGCPSDGADVLDWMAQFVNPWWTAGHTVLLLDHVPKQRKDRPRGGIGSQAKLARLDGAALYAVGQVWNRTDGGYLHLTNHKDRAGCLPGLLGDAVATITVKHAGNHLEYTIGEPTGQSDTAEDLTDELLQALIAAGSARGTLGIRSLITGKGTQIDNACKDLLAQGAITRRKDGAAFVYEPVL